MAGRRVERERPRALGLLPLGPAERLSSRACWCLGTGSRVRRLAGVLRSVTTAIVVVGYVALQSSAHYVPLRACCPVAGDSLAVPGGKIRD